VPITDLVFLEGNKPESILYDEDNFEKGRWFQAKNIDIIPLSKLGSLLGVSSYEELMSEFEPAVPPEGEAVLLNFPIKLQDKLKTLTDNEISKVVVEWCKIEEFYSATEESLKDYLIRLREFLSVSNEPVYLFWSV